MSLLPPEPTLARVSGLMILGNILFYQGDIEDALAHWQENISQAQALGDNRRLANLWQNIGAAETNRGHIARAVEPKEKALALYQRMGDVAGAATIHSNLGEDYMLLRDYETAETHLTTALELAASHQLSQVELFALVNQVRWQLDNGRLAAAATALNRAGALCQQLKLAQQQAEITRLQAELAYRQGDHALALATADEALTLSTNPKEQGLGWRLKGDVWRALAEPAQAEEAYQQSRDILADHNPFECARTLLVWGQHYTGMEAGDKAASLLKTALSTFERLQMPRYATEIRTALGWDEDELAPQRDETAVPEQPSDRPPPALAPATRFLRRELIATGGHGEVYRGQDTETGRQVVIKRLRPELVAHNPEIVARFTREAEALRRLDHPNIVRMLAAQETDEGYIIVMEYMPGGSLRDLLQKQPQLPLARALDVALELADALGRTHHLGVIHRDLKPGNVLLAADGSPRLTDFGIAHMTQQETRLTQEGAMMGTTPYLSPEACMGKELDGRSDIWAFGVMLYEMLAGQHPFSGGQVAATRLYNVCVILQL